MSYKLGKRKQLWVIPGSRNTLPTHQHMCLTRGIAPSKRHSVMSIRSQQRSLLRKAGEQIVKAQVKLEKQWRRKNVGKRLTEPIRRELYAKIKTDAYSIAYRMNPEVFRYART